MTNQVVLSEDGEIIEPSIHDAYMRGLLLCDDAKLLLSIKAVNGKRHCIVLHGVERLRADDFRQENIILNIVVYSAAEINNDDIAYAYGIESTENVFLTQTMKRILKEQKFVVRVNTSFGCSAVCICDSLEFESDQLPL